MIININAENLIDSLSDIMSASNGYNKDAYRKAAPEERERLFYKHHSARQQLWTLRNILGISTDALIAVEKAARKWQERTNWEKCLPEKTAERLIKAMSEQYD